MPLLIFTFIMNEIKLYATMLTILFVISCIAGFYFANENPKLAKKTIEQLFSQFEFIKNMNPSLIFLLIFLNNSIKALVAMLAGFLFGLFPVLFVILNGYLTGLVIQVKGMEMGFKKIALALIPHGIVEIPAIIIACSYGIWLGRRFWNAINGKEKFRNAVFFALKKYLRIVLPMLIVAAIIETFVTPYIAFAFS